MNSLVVDIGNTRLKWAQVIDGDLQPGLPLMHRKQDWPLLFSQAWASLPPPDRVLVSCVAGPAMQAALVDWVREHWPCEVSFLRAPAQGNGIVNSYENPGLLGSDRWAAMVAAYDQAAAAVCVVNCGSAVTLDVVEQGGRHLGGLILPGVHAMLDSLHAHTALPAQDAGDIGRMPILATSTQTAMLAGAVQAITAVIEKTVNRVQSDSSLKLACYLAGGDAALIGAQLSIAHHIEPDLVLKGLAIIARPN